MMHRSLGTMAVLVAMVLPASGADWPTYRHDATRSGIASETLTPPLHPQWGFEPRHGPAPAWPAPARTDYFHKLFNLTPAVTYDRAPHVIVGGGLVYFGSSADDTVYALDAGTGAIRWKFHTAGPVRLAPSYANGRIYFGSDDGQVYCLAADTGALRWSWRPPAPLRILPGNGRLVSDHPVRSGVLVKDGLAYVCVGIFPTQTVYLCALDAETGTPEWVRENGAVSSQGYMLASESYLFVPTGRTNPAVFERATGNYVGAIEGNGGTFALLTGEHLLSGPGRTEKDAMVAADPDTRVSVASFPGTGLVVDGPVAYLQSHERLTALDRARHVAASIERRKLNEQLEPLLDAYDTAKAGNQETRIEELEQRMAPLKARLAELPAGPEDCTLWDIECACPYAMVLAGDTLYAGGDGLVVGVRAEDGARVWESNVLGRAYGLAVANGRLYVSTGVGAIYCFSADGKTQPARVAQSTAPAPYTSGREQARDVAAGLATGTGIVRGYAVLVEPRDLSLTCALDDLTGLNVALAVQDAAEAARLRETLADSGLLGAAVSVHSMDDAAHLPYTTGMANLVVVYPDAQNDMPVALEEALRVARPLGGRVMVPAPGEAGGDAAAVQAWFARGGQEAERLDCGPSAWYACARGAVPGAGEWTQLYADPGHTACSRDTVQGPFTIQWFGHPGPRPMIDRHHRPMSSLFKDGRLFITADNGIITVDAYNGTHLWQLEVPDSRRIGALKNAGHQLITGDALHVLAGNDCWVVEAATGKRRTMLSAPRVLDGPQEWGYLNICGGLLLGTAQHEGASFSEHSVLTCSLLEGDFRPVVASRALFAVDRGTGKPVWRRTAGAYMNTAMALADARLCFIESRGPKAMADDNGRIRIDEFLEGEVVLAALNAKTGEMAWEHPVDYPFQHILFVNATPETILVSGTYNEQVEGETRVFYRLLTYRVENGEPIWEQTFRATNIRGTDFTGPGGTHGENWQHPVILDGTVYARPYAFDLATGEKKDYMLYRGGHGCGGLTASAHYLYGRGDNPRAYPTNVKRTEGIPLTLVNRPGCWLNIIPAGGLVLIPESSSGCTCAYPLQTSVALAPKAWAQPASKKRLARQIPVQP